MKKLILNTILFQFLLIYLGCGNLKMPFAERKLAVLNNSNVSLAALVNLNYPDTTINNTFSTHIYPKEKNYIQLSSRNWGSIFDERGKITVFFVPAAEYERYHGFNKDSYTRLKEYSLTKKDLDSLDWTLTYP